MTEGEFPYEGFQPIGELMSDSPRYSPLHAVHEALGASFTDFAGFMMPVRYDSDLAEHHAVRTAAGIFDISHMAEFFVSGEQAADFLNFALVGRASEISIGRAKYSLICAPDGGIIDDLIVYRLAEFDFLVVANAGNRDNVAAGSDQIGFWMAFPQHPTGAHAGTEASAAIWPGWIALPPFT